MKHIIYGILMISLTATVSCSQSMAIEINNDESDNWHYTCGYKRDDCGNARGGMHYFPESNRFDDDSVEFNNVTQQINRSPLKTSSQNYSQQFNEFAATMGLENTLELSDDDHIHLINTVTTNSTYPLDFLLAMNPYLMD